MSNAPTFHHRPPPYPTRRPETIAAAVRLLQEGEGWTRLEGAPELESDLTRFHASDMRGRAALPWYVASGTAALEAILLGHGVGPGDEVVTTPYTWAAPVAAILAIGAIPVFADIDPLSARVDPAAVAAALTTRSRAILVVHLFGHPVACDELRRIADQAGIPLLEDGSQAHGARYAGRRVGDWGDAAAFSCMGLKLLAGTEGGYALFRDPAAAECAWLYGKHPRGLPAERAAQLAAAGLLDALQLGWRPCAIGAELVRAQLPFLDAENAGRRRNAATLRMALADSQVLVMPDELPQAEGCYHLLSLLTTAACPYPKAEVLARLARCGVGAFDYIPTPIHRLARINAHDYQGPRVFWHEQLRRAGMDYRRISLPGAEERCRRSFELGFNWTGDAPEAMRALAGCLRWACGEGAP